MVIKLLQLNGWRVLHIRPARRKSTEDGERWETPVQCDGKGFCDILALRDDRELIAELKSEKGKKTPEQEEWIQAFLRAGREVYLWRPRDWEEIVEVVSR